MYLLRYIVLLSSIIAVLFVSCLSNSSKDVSQVDTSSSLSIQVLPSKTDTVYLSEIVDSVRLIKLETSEKSLIGDINQIQYDAGRFFCFDSNLKNFRVFDSEGRFITRIGLKGRGPGEFFNPGLFALNKINHEIWLEDNDSRFLKYDYNGNYLDSKDFSLFMKGMVFIDNGLCCYTSKCSNYKNDTSNDYWGAELTIVKDDGKSINRYLPVNKELYPAGEGRLLIDEPTPFSELQDSYTFHFTVSDKIYSIRKSDGSVSEKYVIDYGKYSFKDNLADMKTESMIQYIKDNPDNAGMTNNVVETDDYLLFTYYYQGVKNIFIYDKMKNQSRTGVFFDDITCATYVFRGKGNGKMLFSVISNPMMVRLTNNSKAFLSEEEIYNVAKSNAEDNPLILVSYLK